MDRRQILVYASMFALIMGLYAWYALGYLRKRRVRRALAGEGRLPAKAPRRRGDKVSNGIIVALVVFAVASVWVEQRYGLRVVTPRNSLLGGAVLFVVIFLFLVVRDRCNRDTAVSYALRLESRGDANGAVEALNAAMGEEPSAQRAEALGVVLSRQERWKEAADAFRAAGLLDPQKPMVPLNLALALSSAGTWEEALVVIRDARVASPHEAAYAAGEALVLARLGSVDEAAEQLRQSEELALVAERDQRVDFGSRWAVETACRDALKGAGSVRGFPLVTGAQLSEAMPGSGQGKN